MKKVIIISIILAALLACGGALAIFIAAQDGGIPSESIPAENTPAENVLPADENISADDEVKPVKTTLTIEEVLAAVELAEKQYAENDPICEKLGITPDPNVLKILDDYDAYVEEHSDFGIKGKLWDYQGDLYSLINEIIFSYNFHEDMICSFLAQFGGNDIFGPDTFTDSFVILCDLNNGKYSSAEEFIVKTRPFATSWGYPEAPVEIGFFVFYPYAERITYHPAGEPFDIETTAYVWPGQECVDICRQITENYKLKTENK